MTTASSAASGTGQPPVEIVSSPEAIEDEWEELADRTGASPFLRAGWVAAWWHAFGYGRLEILTARRDRRLVGVLPLVRTARGMRSTTNFETPEYGFVVEDPRTMGVLADALFGHAPRSVLIRLLDSERPDDEQLRRAASRAGYRTLERSSMRSPYLRIDDSWDVYERALSRNLRGDARRRRRRLEEEGTLTLEMHTGSGLPRLLEEGYRLEGSGWKEARGTAIRSRPELRRFYNEIARWAADNGWLRLCFLRLDGRAIAFQLDLVAAGVLYHLKGGFDPDFARFSPGKVLHYLMVEHAFKTGLRRYEFLGEDEPYKLKLANASHERLQFHAFAPRLTAQAERLAYTVALPTGRRLLESRKRAT